MPEPIKLKLSRPVMGHAEKPEHELTFREPTGRDIMRCGMPFTLEEKPDSLNNIVRVDAEACGKLISACTMIPEPGVWQLHPSDFKNAVGIIISFFGAPLPVKSGEASSDSPGSTTT